MALVAGRGGPPDPACGCRSEGRPEGSRRELPSGVLQDKRRRLERFEVPLRVRGDGLRLRGASGPPVPSAILSLDREKRLLPSFYPLAFLFLNAQALYF